MRNRVKDDYYQWLSFMAIGNSHEYKLLCKDLFNTNFRWFVPNDINREFEGKNLREKFCDEHGTDYKRYGQD